jgi:serine/threonine-protein kinase
MGLSMSAAILATVVYLARLDRRRDVDTDFWGKLWTGRAGRIAFAIARRFVGRGVRASAVTHRATELSLGMAAESLFESLPSATRASLGDLPRVIHRLQQDARKLRELHDGLQDGVTAASGAADSADYRDLVVYRDRAHDRLTQAVGALETIRLNLLRLHAGSGTVEALTTHIEIADEVSREVSRLIAARSEVERGLAYPRETAATPV